MDFFQDECVLSKTTQYSSDEQLRYFPAVSFSRLFSTIYHSMRIYYLLIMKFYNIPNALLWDKLMIVIKFLFE